MAVHQDLTAVECGTGTRWPHWQRRLPEFTGAALRLRELNAADAPALLEHLNAAPVIHYLSPCPTTPEGFKQFIRWTQHERRLGRHACFGIVPNGHTRPVGILQVWPIERDFSVAEWGFVLGSAYWGTGLFIEAATLLLDAIFHDRLFGPPGVRRLEARAVDRNGRGNGVLRKLGATPEGILRRAFVNGAGTFDHVMWSILAADWAAVRHQARVS